MLVIYFYEGSEDEPVALETRKQLRLMDIPAVVRNAGAYRASNGLEICDAVLALNCPDIADAYEERNRSIQMALEREDYQKFAGISQVEVFRSVEDLEATLFTEDPPAAKDVVPVSAAFDASTLSKQELIDLGATRGIILDMSMTKAQMLEKLQ